MQQSQIDGVPVLWEQGPPPFTAALVFGVGARHETFRTLSVTHLIEHLVMHSMPRSIVERNAMVDLDTTVFHATGDSDRVVEFINRVCGALAALPYERMEREVGVLRAEDSCVEHPALAAMLQLRYGLRGPGLAGAGGPGPEQLTKTHVREHLERHFTRANAVLVLSGPVPAGVELTLAPGDRVDFPVADHLPWAMPTRVTSEQPLVVVSGLVTEANNSAFVAESIRDRLEQDLRGRQGIAYEIGSGGAPTRFRESLVAVWADGHADKWDAVVSSTWSTVKELARTGPTVAELEHMQASATADLRDLRAVVDWLVHQAARQLAGHAVRSRDEQIGLDAEVTCDSIRRAAGQFLDTAILHSPDMSLDLPDLPDGTEQGPPPATPVTTDVFGRRTFTLAPRKLAIGMDDHAISLTVGDQVIRAPWAEVVGLATAPRLRELVLADGRAIPVIAKSFRDSDRLLAAIDARLGHLAFTVDPSDILE